MLLRTHLVFAVFVYFTLNFILEIPNKVLFLVFVLLGAFFVDIDSKKSKLGRIVFFRPFQLFFKHRGPIHGLFFAILFSLILALFDRWSGFGFFVGYFSHLILDLLTPAGVRLFWPIFIGKFSFRIRSGGVFEKILFVLFLLFDVFVVGWMFFHYLF